MAIVKDGWKYITPSNGPAVMKDVNIETGYSKDDQLYHLKSDPRELQNVVTKYPEKLLELKNLLMKIRDSYK